MGTEIVHKNRDNTNDFILKSNGSAVDLAGVTKMELVFSDTLIVSSETSPGVFDWSPGSGKLFLSLGKIQGLKVGMYPKPKPSLIVYDAINTNGINWGQIVLEIV